MTFIHVLLGPFYTSLLCFHWSPTILNIVFYMSLCICILYVEINEMEMKCDHLCGYRPLRARRVLMA